MMPLAATSHTRPTTAATTCVWPSRAPVRVRCPGVCAVSSGVPRHCVSQSLFG